MGLGPSKAREVGVDMLDANTRGHVQIPGITCPFPPSVSLYATEANEAHARWADDHGIFCTEEERLRFRAMNMGDLAGRLHPEAERTEDVRLVADWCAWLLLRDDRWDSTEDPRDWERLADRDRAYLRLMRRMRGGDEEDGLAGALANLCARTRERARENGLADPVDGRFVSVMKSFFSASVRQAFHQRRKECPTLAEYLEDRPVTGGLDILTFVLAAIDGVRLPESLLALPDLEKLTRISHDVCCWHNDLVSLNKELLAGEVNNLILVLLLDHESSCWTLSEAVDCAVGMIDEELVSFASLEREVRAAPGRPHAATWYARMLCNRVAGIIYWQERCARYQEAAF